MSISCYNKGCGQKFDPDSNSDESCIYHPGVPVFHDAYKGWSCCNKKSIDFTEFLNFKGCTLGKHSNLKPPEPEKPSKNVEIDQDIMPVGTPIKPASLSRPDFDAPLILVSPIISPAFKEQIDKMPPPELKVPMDLSEITIGTACKNRGCNAEYKSSDSNFSNCTHHPGVPIFHEGLKFWSCCTKRTTDFTAFINQVGCTDGNHKWTLDASESKEIKCRFDWHQTSTKVVIAIYAKMYHYEKSTVKVNPIRLMVNLVFPEQDNEFNLDLELRGIIDVPKTTINMYGTKIEISMTKAEPGTWTLLDFPRKLPSSDLNVENTLAADSDDESDVDLNDIEPLSLSGATITEIS